LPNSWKRLEVGRLRAGDDEEDIALLAVEASDERSIFEANPYQDDSYGRRRGGEASPTRLTPPR
jgi:hypothetical protein